jgi:hypothetical protein
MFVLPYATKRAAKQSSKVKTESPQTESRTAGKE